MQLKRSFSAFLIFDASKALSFLVPIFVVGLSGCSDVKTPLDPENIAKLARSGSVKIEGATQGSGFIESISCAGGVSRSPFSKPYCNIEYKVITAAHVVKNLRSDDELSIITFDGVPHAVTSVEINSSGLDIARLTFNIEAPKYSSLNILNLSDKSRGSVESPLQVGETLYVSGFPLATTAVPNRSLRFTDGKLIAVLDEKVVGGYQVLYSNSTLPGMSGSPVFNRSGQVVAMHGRGEVEATLTSQTGIAVKTGQNQGIPLFIQNRAIQYTNIYPKPTISSVDAPIGTLIRPFTNDGPVEQPKQPFNFSTEPLTSDAPTDKQLEDLVQGWLDAKANALAGPSNVVTDAASNDISTVARDRLLQRVKAERAGDAALGRTKIIKTSVTSVEVESRTLRRIAVKAEVVYSDQTLDRSGTTIDQTPAVALTVIYVLGRDGKQWRLHEYVSDF